MYFVYILFCNKAFFYTGVTDNLSKRLEEHQRGYSPHTKRYSHLELIYSESYTTRLEAEKRERQIKCWAKQKKKALIARDLDKLKFLSRSKS